MQRVTRVQLKDIGSAITSSESVCLYVSKDGKIVRGDEKGVCTSIATRV